MNIYFKRYWEEEGILFYLHFRNGWPCRQIEIHSDKRLFMSEEHPQCGEFFLCDQPLSELDTNELNEIEEKEFERVWNTQKNQ
jgi:hypothetical protein